MAYPKVNTSYLSTGYNLTRCSRNRRSSKDLKYIVVHYTATDASAKNNCIYFRTGDRQSSADYFIDKDGSIYKFNPDCAWYYTWQCGDGYGKYGITNANSIGIEVVSSGAEYTAAQKTSLNKLVRGIMEDYGVASTRVVRHYDASRKICPKPYAGTTAKDVKWKSLHSAITAKVASTVTSTSSSAKADANKFPYLVTVTCDVLNVRNGAGTNYKVNTTVKRGEVYTIVAESGRWGKLKSGAGWICLDYTAKR